MATQTLNPDDSGSWLQWVSDFDNTYQQFHANFDALSSPDMADYISSQHPELVGTYNDLVARGNTHAATLDKLKATRDYVWSWLQWLNTGLQSGIDFVSSSAQSAYDAAKSFFGLGAVPRAVLVRNGLHGLGIVPAVVIGVAAAAAALVVIGYWIHDAYMFAQRVNALKQQEDFFRSQGMSADQAATAAQRAVDNTLGPASAAAGNNLLGIPWNLVITGAVLVFLGPPIVEALSGGRRARA